MYSVFGLEICKAFWIAVGYHGHIFISQLNIIVKYRVIRNRKTNEISGYRVTMLPVCDLFCFITGDGFILKQAIAGSLYVTGFVIIMSIESALSSSRRFLHGHQSLPRMVHWATTWPECRHGLFEWMNQNLCWVEHPGNRYWLNPTQQHWCLMENWSANLLLPE